MVEMLKKKKKKTIKLSVLNKIGVRRVHNKHKSEKARPSCPN